MTDSTRRAEAPTAAPTPDWNRIHAKLALDNVENGVPPGEADETLAEMKREWAATGQIIGWTVPDPNARVGPAECSGSCPCPFCQDAEW